jgi:hypothetical protein
MIYLASPYSHPDPAVREARYNAAALCAATCLNVGQHIFSPIAYGHILHEINPTLGTSAAAWRAFNTAMLRHASTLCVLQLSGWEESAGVLEEMTMAKALGIPIYFIENMEVPKDLRQ